MIKKRLRRSGTLCLRTEVLQHTGVAALSGAPAHRLP